MGLTSSLLKVNRVQSGFTLIEVILTISILVTIVLGITSMLRNTLDLRAALSEETQVTNRIGMVMAKVADDLQHAFHLSRKDLVRNDPGRTFKTKFFIEPHTESDVLLLTTFTHHTLFAAGNEGDQTLVRYEVRKDAKNSARSNLYRLETPRVPEDMKSLAKDKIFARDIKQLHLSPWLGDSWSKDGWDTEKKDFQNSVPRMVKVEVEAWTKEAPPEETAADGGTIKLTTIVYIPTSFGMEEQKTQDSTISWEKF